MLQAGTGHSIKRLFKRSQDNQFGPYVWAGRVPPKGIQSAMTHMSPFVAYLLVSTIPQLADTNSQSVCSTVCLHGPVMV